MMENKSSKSTLRNLSPYIIASCLSLLAAFLLLKLWRANWGIQFFYFGDAMFYDMLVKGIVENGWYLNNKNLGMPFGATFHDFPAPDTFTLLLFKFLSYFTDNQHLIINIFYIATFPLTTITSLYVLRQFNISFFPALLSSLLYAFTTYHLSRSEIHLMYTAYFVIPLIVLVILWVCAAGSRRDDEEQEGLRLSLRNRKFIFSLVVCALISSTGGVYYSFFACYLLIVIGIIQAIAFKQIRRLFLPGVLTGVIFFVLVANLSPNVIYQLKNGKTETARRDPGEAEFFGLKMAQMVLPVTGHRDKGFRRIKDKYNHAPLVNENDDATLGLIGSIGFMTLLGWLVCNAFSLGRREENPTQNLLGHLSVLNMSAFLLGTIGGFSAIFALMVSPQIRSYNRISIYIAFFSLFAIALLLDKARQRFFRTGGLRLVFSVLAIILTILGLLDQSSKRFVPDYAGVKKEFENDADIVRRIEASVPAGAMIFQLPVKRFPETSPIERLFDYDLLKGYIHSKQLRWSYGAMRGRVGDIWQASVVAKPIPEMIETVAVAGFEGIYIDRFGYADNAAKLESDLAALLKAEPLVSQDQRQSFFNLSAYRTALSQKYSPEELAIKQKDVSYPVQAVWERGCAGAENKPGEEWRWCGSSGELVINNYAPYARRVTLEMSLGTATEGNMRIESPFFTEELKTYPQELKPFSKTFDVPPGKHRLKFTSDAQRLHAPQDSRTMVFRVINLNLKNAG
jgi:phosphoglycerol transferase